MNHPLSYHPKNLAPPAHVNDVYDVPSRYHFTYHVSDSYSGDVHHHSESKSDHKTEGQYSVKLPDGRTQVEYHHQVQQSQIHIYRLSPTQRMMEDTMLLLSIMVETSIIINLLLPTMCQVFQQLNTSTSMTPLQDHPTINQITLHSYQNYFLLQSLPKKASNLRQLSSLMNLLKPSTDTLLCQH